MTKENENIEVISEFEMTENFENLLSEFEETTQDLSEGSVIKGVIVEIDDKAATVDVGGKAVGYVPLEEFKADGEIKIGDVVDVFLERLENKRGDMSISRDNARRSKNWTYLKDCLDAKTIIEGDIMGKVKGGFAVDMGGVIAFLPRSQVDTFVLTEMDEFIGKKEQFLVLKIDDIRGNVVVSRRAILEEERSKEREKILATIAIDDELEGVVKNLTDYGAFIDFGSFDGLLHLTDISWCRVRHPSEVLSVGQKVKVKVIKFDEETKRVSLGMKQLQENPWSTITEKYPVGSVVKGHVTNIAQYGAFVEIENGIEGLVHVSEMSWLKNNVNPSKFLSVSQEVEVMILDIDAEHHRISLGIKQCEKNPWQNFSDSHKVGDVIKGSIKNVTEFGLFIGFNSGVDGLAHVSDIVEDGQDEKEVMAQFKKGDEVEAILLGTSYEKERISLGVKQLKNENFKEEMKKLVRGADVSCVIRAVKKDFIEAEIDLGLKGIVKRIDLSDNKKDQRTDRFEVGERIEAKVVSFNNLTGKLVLTMKPLREGGREESEENTSYAEYMSDDSSDTTLGSILGGVLEESRAIAEKNADK